jgi:hypothetical protein
MAALYAYRVFHTCHVSRPSPSSSFVHPNNIWWWVATMKLHTVQFPPVPFYLVPLRPKYLLQNPIFQNPQPIYLPQCERPSFTLHWFEVFMVTSVLLFHYGGSKSLLIC